MTTKDEVLYSSVPITKSVVQEDGTLMVYGLATDSSLDHDKQIADPTWLATAMPKWFKDSGNIREQHSNIAAGVAKGLENDGDKWFVTAHVVDPVSVKKVEAGVLKEFSIGIRNARVVKDATAKGGRIVDGLIAELSLVDRGANMNAKFVIAKAMNGSTELTEVGAEEVINKDVFVNEVPEQGEDPQPVDLPDNTIITPADGVDAGLVPLETQHEANEVANEKTTYAEIVKKAKEIVASSPLNKEFNEADFQAARTALAGLISSEADDLAKGDDEEYSLNCLIQALGYLMSWQMGEMWEVTAEKLFGVKTDKAVGADNSLSSEIVEEINKAVKSATEGILKEVGTLKESNETLQKALDEKETELQAALNKAKGGGPKKTQTEGVIVKNDHLTKAREFRRLAEINKSDVILARGYIERAKAEELLAK